MQELSGKDIQQKIQRKFSHRLAIFLEICIFCLAVVLFLDVKEYFGELMCKQRYFYEEFYDIISVMNTILAASVVFFYSIQDNCKAGIPHRVIMLYTFGEFTVPVVFFIELIMQPLILLAAFFEIYTVSFVMIVMDFILQILVIIFILLATCYHYCTYAIFNVEIRQFLLFFHLDRKLENSDIKLIWSYFIKYMKYVVESNDLSIERTDLFRKLLRVPFYKKEQSMYEYWLKKSAEKLAYNDDFSNKDERWELYCFYYNNLLPVFEYLSGEGKIEERNIYYDILYEFLNDLDKIYRCKIKEDLTCLEENYHIIVSAIMNACMMSTVPEKEEFCIYIFNNCLCDKIRIRQIGLYILFLEFLYKISVDKIPSKEFPVKLIGNIRYYINCWKNSIKQNETREGLRTMYIEHWKIWSTWSSVSNIFSYEVLQNAISTIFEQSFESVPITYIMNKSGREWT